ncbi:MAG: ATP-binding protein [Alphaproteobacteria bacterium PRO2]|nr:ATP-binding protein [Alphaproteobacteria bacterium PRO2]
MSLEIHEHDIARRLAEDNPWWDSSNTEEDIPYQGLPHRDYFDSFLKLTQTPVQRAVILMGPRRVGKTVMLHQLVGHLLKNNFSKNQILYCSVDTPTYSGLSLEKILQICENHTGHDKKAKRCVIFDEIQYLKDWERHLKILVDKFPKTKFIASGSAAAALKLKSQESGAGRFTDFILPPLTFAEYIRFSNKEHLLISEKQGSAGPRSREYSCNNIEELNQELIKYLNYGGYPEAVMQPEVREEANRFLGKDIIDKILLKDLPNLYGIDNIAELNRLFTMIAYHTGCEVNLESLASSSNVSKNTIIKYLEYLESAFLIWRVHKVNESGKTFKRIRHFKVYLTNPSMRASLFAPLTEDDPALGHVIETGIFSQWVHTEEKIEIHYARWAGGEVDMVYLDKTTSMKPIWAVEIKWSDNYASQNKSLKNILEFVQKIKLDSITITTKTISNILNIGGIKISQVPSSLYCYTVGKNLLRHKNFKNASQI